MHQLTEKFVEASKDCDFIAVPYYKEAAAMTFTAL
jgi:hypothetical protein